MVDLFITPVMTGISAANEILINTVSQKVPTF